MGIEPTAPAWEAGVLPLYDARFFGKRQQCGKNAGAVQAQRLAAPAFQHADCCKNNQFMAISIRRVLLLFKSALATLSCSV